MMAGLPLSEMAEPMALDGNINGDWFEAYVEMVLVLTRKPSDIDILDGLLSYKSPFFKVLIEASNRRPVNL